MGAAIATAFHAEGARVCVTDIDVENGVRIAGKFGDRGCFRELDVRDAERWASVVADCIREFQRVDILVNNAGFAERQPIEDETIEYHEGVIRTNVTGVWNGMRSVLPCMRSQRSGSIINIASIDGLVGVPGMASFVASKFAVTGLTRTVALEVGHHGIRVNTIHPGAIATNQMAGREHDVYESMQLAHQALPRIGHPEEIANMAVFLASSASSYCTGASFVVDGGHLAGPYRSTFPYDSDQAP
jgi:3alpha(or 20beta)-hydroxysteroid dehydrogenase